MKNKITNFQILIFQIYSCKIFGLDNGLDQPKRRFNNKMSQNKLTSQLVVLFILNIQFKRIDKIDFISLYHKIYDVRSMYH